MADSKGYLWVQQFGLFSAWLPTKTPQLSASPSTFQSKFGVLSSSPSLLHRLAMTWDYRDHYGTKFVLAAQRTQRGTWHVVGV